MAALIRMEMAIPMTATFARLSRAQMTAVLQLIQTGTEYLTGATIARSSQGQKPITGARSSNCIRLP